MSIIPPNTFVLLLAAAVLGLVLIRLTWVWRKAKEAGKKPSQSLLLFVSVLAIGLSGYVIWKEIQSNLPYRYDPAADQELGRALAGVFLSAPTESGEVVILSAAGADEDSAQWHPSARVRLDSLVEAMREDGHAQPVVVSLMDIMREISASLDGDEVAMMESYILMEGGVPVEVFYRLWEKHPEGKIFISLGGPPIGVMSEIKERKPAGSQLYALDFMFFGIDVESLNETPVDGLVVQRFYHDTAPSGAAAPVVVTGDYVFLQP